MSRAVRIMIDVLDGEMSRAKIMKAIGIKDRVTFADYYLAPALKLGIVEMTQPNSPRSPTQKYRLTPKGLAVKGGRVMAESRAETVGRFMTDAISVLYRKRAI